MSLTSFFAAREQLLRADTEEPGLRSACSEVVDAFRRVTTFSACALMTTDPETLLPTGGVVEGFDPQLCGPFWDNELLDPDVNKFTDLALEADPVTTLVEAVDGQLERSPRYRNLYAPFGATDELRVAFKAGTTCLAVGAFVRVEPHGPFDESELVDVRQLVPIASQLLRNALGRVEQYAGSATPVTLIVEPSGEISAATEGASRLLDELRSDGVDQPGLPTTVRLAASRARWGRSPTTTALRAHGADGRWYRIHVAPLVAEAGRVAVTIEAARPGDLVPILLESYGLTRRETQVVLRLARGLAPKEIAVELGVSVHTVRDHTKAVFDKAGVSSRGELIARLFADHVLEHFHAAVTARSGSPG